MMARLWPRLIASDVILPERQMQFG